MFTRSLARDAYAILEHEHGSELMEGMNMRNLKLMSWMILLGAGCAMAQPVPATQPAQASEWTEAAPINPAADVILDDLDHVGEDLNDFTADISLTETDMTFGDASTRAGTVKYLNKGGDDALLTITFKTIQTADREPKPAEKDYMLKDGWLVERDYRNKEEINRQIVEPGKKLNLLKLGEGPFPLLIGQDKEEVHRLFDVTLVDAADGPHLHLVPKPGSQFARKFKFMDLWVDAESKMPRKIEITNTGGNTLTTTELSDIKLNAGLNESDLILPPIKDSDWNRRDEKYQE
jgi:outer membrane lipoprotein-sorting protein